MSQAFTCDRCGRSYEADDGKTGATGYGYDAADRKICYACCADDDRAYMRDNGRIALYLTEEPRASTVSNWPGSLRFAVTSVRKGRHNIAGTRTDVWFRDADGNRWHGVQYGRFTQIVHCRRIGAAKDTGHGNVPNVHA